MENILIFTDGSSRGNPGPGGWGAVVVANERVVELGGGETHTTNNRMELLSTVKALKALGKTIKLLYLVPQSCRLFKFLELYGFLHLNFHFLKRSRIFDRLPDHKRNLTNMSVRAVYPFQ